MSDELDNLDAALTSNVHHKKKRKRHKKQKGTIKEEHQGSPETRLEITARNLPSNEGSCPHVFEIRSDSSGTFEISGQFVEELELVNILNRSTLSFFADDYCSIWEQLHIQKTRLSHCFETGGEAEYYREREFQFPQDRRGSSKFASRAGDKLWQILETSNLLDVLDSYRGKQYCFFDICGGPGAFSDLMLNHFDDVFKSGFGITLQIPLTDSDEIWYRSLVNHPNFHIIWGSSGDGDVTRLENFEYCKTHCRNVSLVLADGGFEIPTINGHKPHSYQELIVGLLILSEFNLTISVLEPGGSAILKLFDCFSTFTYSLLYCSSMMFETVFIVKPPSSRMVNSERYMVAINLKQVDSTLDLLKSLLQKEQQAIYDRNNIQSVENSAEESKSKSGCFLPRSVIPVELFCCDTTFMKSMHDMNYAIATSQTQALKSILDSIHITKLTNNVDRE